MYCRILTEDLSISLSLFDPKRLNSMNDNRQQLESRSTEVPSLDGVTLQLLFPVPLPHWWDWGYHGFLHLLRLGCPRPTHWGGSN